MALNRRSGIQNGINSLVKTDLSRNELRAKNWILENEVRLQLIILIKALAKVIRILKRL
jgi:hypothetical protein